ncbi:GDSL esterase/lipase EXL3-like isoform X2 [Carica papaya]|uniref:GDSL esterase/lipase EXL3-like isoform X2 n=1 Tax=Carica papaya TaxID=3649 RepID=UPI000B8C8FDA|nr:GDSL esterase/lipase EXL3-like isoform X2 [Carica papaya]
MFFLFDYSKYYSYIILLVIVCIVLYNDDYIVSANGGRNIILRDNETVPALIMFGDSIVDPGNNNYLKTIVKCNFPPYGRDFQGGNPTGRFCNGKIPSDYIAEEFGLKELLPAFLDPSLQPQDLLTGVSFASGGSGYDPLTPAIVSVLSLTDQLELFKRYLARVDSSFGKEATANILSKAIFLVCSGSDDIANTYFSTPFRRAHYDINSYTDLVVSSASSFIQQLYGVGARRIGVFSLPPIGCVPSQRTLGGGLNRECSNKANQAALLINSKLNVQLNSLRKKLPGSKLVYVDIYNPLLSLIKNPAQYVANRGCCGTGNIEVSILCNSLDDSKSCPDASKYIFWDSYHPSEKAYEVLSPLILSKCIREFF